MKFPQVPQPHPVSLVSLFVQTALVVLLSALVAEAQPLASIAEIRQIQTEDIKDQAVDFDATVTYSDELWSFLFAQEGSEAIFVHSVPAEGIQAGDRVNVKGTLSKGDLSPVIYSKKVTRLERSTIPEPVQIEIDDVEFGDHDCMFVQTECEVLQALAGLEDSLLYCRTTNGQKLFIKVKHPNDSFSDARYLAGKKISLEGCMGLQLESPAFAAPGQASNVIVGFKLFCSSPNAVKPIGPLHDSPTPTAMSIADLRNDEMNDPRFLTHGQISLIHFSDKGKDYDEIVVADDSNSLRIKVHSAWDLYPGMILRMQGSKTTGEDGEVHIHADYLKRMNISLLQQPTAKEVSQAIQEYRPDERIAVEGKPISVSADSNGTRFLTIAEGTSRIDVKLQRDAVESLASVEPGIASRIRVTGVAMPTEMEDSTSAIQIEVARAEDLELVESRTPATRIVTGVFAALFAAIALAALWIKTLSAKVEEKTKDARDVSAQLRSSYDAIDDGVLAMDSNQVVVAVNREFRRITDANIQLGDTINDLPNQLERRLKQPKSFQDRWRDCLENPSVVSSFGVEFNRPRTSFVAVRSAPIMAEGEEHPIGRVLIFRDETENKQLQAELLHSNKLEAIGRLVGGVAHDFNNVLTAVTANLAIARFDADASVRSVEPELSIAEDAAFRGADIIRRLLTFSAKKEFDLKPCAVNAVIHRLRDLVRHSIDASIDFEFNLCLDNPFINAESTAIEQVLLNLYVNARDALPDGGKIWTSTEVVKDPATSRFVVIITVEDNGIGVPESIRNQIFEPFFTTKDIEKGSGLGLSVSYSVIKQHGGTIQYNNRAAGGSTFKIVLPLEPATDEAPKEEIDEIPNGTGTVLVVDDEDVVRAVAQTILQHKGFDTLSAASGEEALSVIRKEPGSVDVVLLDLTMPEMSGREVLKSIRRDWPHIPVVLCSGYLFGDSTSLADPAGPDAMVSKPYSMRQLVTAVSNVIDGRYRRIEKS